MDTCNNYPDATPRALPSLPGAASSSVKIKDLTAEDRAKVYTERAFEVLVEIMNDPLCGKRTRLDAANMLLDRGWGKPTVKHEAPMVVTLQDALRQLDAKDKRYQATIHDAEVIEEPVLLSVETQEDIDWGDAI